jgi:hypothetical protein
MQVHEPEVSEVSRKNNERAEGRREKLLTEDAVLKGLSHEIDFKNVVENGQILALIRAAAGF